MFAEGEIPVDAVDGAPSGLEMRPSETETPILAGTEAPIEDDATEAATETPNIAGIIAPTEDVATEDATETPNIAGTISTEAAGTEVAMSAADPIVASDEALVQSDVEMDHILPQPATGDT